VIPYGTAAVINGPPNNNGYTQRSHVVAGGGANCFGGCAGEGQVFGH